MCEVSLAFGGSLRQLGPIKKFAPKTVRMSGSMKLDVEKLWKTVSGKKSAFYRAAIDFGANLDKDTFYEAFRHFQDGKASASDGVSLTKRHIDLLEERVEQLVQKLKKPKRARKNKRPKVIGGEDKDTDLVALALEEPSLSAVVRVMLRLYIDSLPQTVVAQVEQEQLRINSVLEGLFLNPILMENKAVPSEVLRRRLPGAGLLVDLPKGGDYLLFIDASALVAATVRIPSGALHSGESQHDSASPLVRGILSKAVRGGIELVVFRTEVIRYCQLLFEAFDGNCAGPEKMREKVVTKGQWIMNSGLKIADIESTALIRAAENQQPLPFHLKLMVAQMGLMAGGRKVLVVSCCQELVGASDEVLVWHPNDLPLSTPPPTTSDTNERSEEKPDGFMINNRPPANNPPPFKIRPSFKKRPPEIDCPF